MNSSQQAGTCPICAEKISFNPDGIALKAKKCPHCHEFIHAPSIFEAMEKCLSKRIQDIKIQNFVKRGFPYLWALVVSAVTALILFLMLFFLKLETRPASWILIFVVFLIVFLIWIKPLNIQPTVLIAFVTLLFVGLGNLWQKENFELRK